MTDYAELESKLRKTRRDLADALDEIDELERKVLNLESLLTRQKVCNDIGEIIDYSYSNDEKKDA